MFGENLHIENTCADCPLRDIIDPATARIIGSGSGLGFGVGSYVDTKCEDAEGRQVEVRVSQAAQRTGLPNEIYADSDMDMASTQSAKQMVEACIRPERQGLLRLKHCLGGITFRIINDKEKADNRWVREQMARGSGAMQVNGPRTKFRSR